MPICSRLRGPTKQALQYPSGGYKLGDRHWHLICFAQQYYKKKLCISFKFCIFAV